MALFLQAVAAATAIPRDSSPSTSRVRHRLGAVKTGRIGYGSITVSWTWGFSFRNMVTKTTIPMSLSSDAR
jgi:hypothetical protein